MWKYSKASLNHLDSCNSDLQILANELIKHRDVRIVQGHRGEEEQNAAFSAGRSKLKFPLSRHNTLPSGAVDMIPYPFPTWGWSNTKRARDFWIGWGNYVKGAADALGINVRWGGDWNSNWESIDTKFFDGPHFELI